VSLEKQVRGRKAAPKMLKAGAEGAGRKAAPKMLKAGAEGAGQKLHRKCSRREPRARGRDAPEEQKAESNGA
jgi:hypothetical protein